MSQAIAFCLNSLCLENALSLIAQLGLGLGIMIAFFMIAVLRMYWSHTHTK